MASQLYKSQLRLVNCTFSLSFEAKQLSKLIHQNQFNVSVHVNKKRVSRKRYSKATKRRFQNEIDELL